MQDLLAWAREVWPYLFTIAYVGGAAWVTVDAVLRKRHAPAVVSWVGLAWLAPISGAIAYYLLGINRIQRSASRLDRQSAAGPAGAASRAVTAGRASRGVLDLPHPGLAGLLRLGDRVTGRPVYAGNRIGPLVDGDAAYPAMLAAIDAATQSVTLVSYIFDNDFAGHAFRDALARAREAATSSAQPLDTLYGSYPPIGSVSR